MATPLEAQISGVDNMNYMYSINANNGQTQITVDFDVKTDPNIDQVLDSIAHLASAVAIAGAGEHRGIDRSKSRFPRP